MTRTRITFKTTDFCGEQHLKTTWTRNGDFMRVCAERLFGRHAVFSTSAELPCVDAPGAVLRCSPDDGDFYVISRGEITVEFLE